MADLLKVSGCLHSDIELRRAKLCEMGDGYELLCSDTPNKRYKWDEVVVVSKLFAIMYSVLSEPVTILWP